MKRVPQMFCIALRSMSRLRFGLDLSTSAGPSHGFGCKVTTYFRYDKEKEKFFHANFIAEGNRGVGGKCRHVVTACGHDVTA